MTVANKNGSERDSELARFDTGDLVLVEPDTDSNLWDTTETIPKLRDLGSITSNS